MPNFFFFNDTATTEIYTLSLHDALPICRRQAQILEAEGEAKAIDTVFRAIHDGKPDSELLAYQYVQALPEIANGQANKVWIIPSEFAHALGRLGDALGGGSAPDEK